jgi:hypothetical protein
LALLRIQRELFGGDLVFADSAQAAAVVQAHSDSAGRVAARFEVDHTLPGWQVIERLANARSGASPGPYAIRMSFVDAAAPERLNVPVQFVPHCPLLCRSGLEPVLRPLRL